MSEADAASSVPSGRRFDSQRELEAKWDIEKMRDDWKVPEQDISREHMTSNDNPLHCQAVVSGYVVDPVRF